MIKLYRVCKNQEAWRPENANELKATDASDNCREFFQLIQAIGNKKSSARKTICKSDKTPINNINRRLEWWTEPVTADPSDEMEVLKWLLLSKLIESSGLDKLLPALCWDGGDLFNFFRASGTRV